MKKRPEPGEAVPAVPTISPGPAQHKKPYEKPAFVREQLFETMALACGKTNPVIGQCKAVKKNS
jgi:hypothetical protein